MSHQNFDKNFTANETAETETTVWYTTPGEPFEIYGLMPEKDGLLSRRMPLAYAETVSTGVAGQCGYGAGGRILFSTDSPYVALRVEYGAGVVHTVCNHCLCYGFDLYKVREGREVFIAACRPVAEFDYHRAEYKAQTWTNGEMTCFTLNFPNFSEVKALSIGLQKGSRLEKGRPYRNGKPVVFYGSSITHGAAAGRPGNAYPSFISQKYNLDYVNLGFAGKALGETVMANYIASLDMCAFVCDFDHNANTVERLLTAHYRLYEIVRRSHPDIPYIIVTRPDYYPNEEKHSKLWAVIRDTYDRAIAAGDENVYFVDGRHLFDGEFYDSCTSDGIHPNDLGFYRMAEKIGPVVAKALGIAEYR